MASYKVQVKLDLLRLRLRKWSAQVETGGGGGGGGIHRIQNWAVRGGEGVRSTSV